MNSTSEDLHTTFHEEEIEKLLSDLSITIQPDQNTLLRAKNLIMAEVNKDIAAHPLPVPRPSLLSLFVIRRNAMSLFILVFVMLLAGAGVVAAAQNDIPGEPLYSVKLASEQIIETLAITPQAKVQVESTLAERRLKEIAILKAKNKKEGEDNAKVLSDIRSTALRLKTKIEQAQDEVKKLKTESDTTATLEVTTQLEAKVVLMQKALAVLFASETKAELKTDLHDASNKAELLAIETRAATNAASEKEIKQKGLAVSARNRVAAAEEKFNALTKKRSSALLSAEGSANLTLLKPLMDGRMYYKQAAQLLAEAHAAITANQFEIAWAKANAAFTAMAKVENPSLDRALINPATPEEKKAERTFDSESFMEEEHPDEIKGQDNPKEKAHREDMTERDTHENIMPPPAALEIHSEANADVEGQINHGIRVEGQGTVSGGIKTMP